MDTNNSDLGNVFVDVTVMLGSTSMPIHQFLRVSRGAVIAFDSLENEDVVIYANNQPIAKGSVMVEDGRIGVAITKMLKHVPGARHLS